MLKINVKDIDIPDSILPKVYSTQELNETCYFIGRENSLKALRFGLEMEKDGYNVFLVGIPRTGRKTFVRNILNEYSQKKPQPPDVAYVMDFEDPNHAKVIFLPPGKGIEFKRDMARLVDGLYEKIIKLFESEEYKTRKDEIDENFERARNRLTQELIEKARHLGFAIKFLQTGITYYPVKDNRILTEEEFQNLTEEEKNEILERSKKLSYIIDGTLEQIRKLESDYKNNIYDLNRYALLFVTEELFSQIEEKYNFSDVREYIKCVKEDLVQRINKLRKNEELSEYFEEAYSVNLIVDNSGINGAPVIFEDTPTYNNLFGKIEYVESQGALYTDFTMIRPGTIHQANGGYLVLEAEELLKYPFVWDRLKKIMFSKTIEIQNADTAYGYSTIATLKVDPIPAKLKLVLIGTPETYEILYNYDPDFVKLFKVKVECDWELEATSENVSKLSSFISTYVRENQELHVSRSGLKEIVRYLSKLTGNREKISISLGNVIDLLAESTFFAHQRKSKLIEDVDVERALKDREDRIKLVVDKYDEMFKTGEIIIDVSGKAVGQVNGLTVVYFGDYEFGLPVRITAKTYLGTPGILDIQREVDLSGQIHSKAVMILNGYLGSKYAQKVPFSISVSVSFEQVYSYLEGDSASLAEVLAIISAISKIPLKQNIAVTGSINQHGQVQPVGGVTEKVEGFYRICKIKDLTGEQGVLIPKANVKNLILKKEILKDIERGLFHVYAVDNVDEAITLMTDKKAGILNRNNEYPAGTVNYYVVKALKEAYSASEKQAKKRKTPRKRK